MDFDVLIASDLRFPGGTSHSIGEEIQAQQRAGYRTALVHLNGPLIQKLRGVNPLIRRLINQGTAELLIGPERVRAKVLVLRHPAVVQHALDQLPPLEVEHVLVVANAGPLDIDGHQHYDTGAVDAAVREQLGVEPMWAPIGPLVRAKIAPTVPAERLLGEDWVNIIDVDAWALPHRNWRADRPVIGRHSRSSPQKWPADAATIRQVYPEDGSWHVRVLGGAKPVEDVLGQIPETWQVQPFGAISPREFLSELDFFVYYHDPRWVEAFGRTILEALAAGVVAVLPPHFEVLFGPAARYTEPENVREVVNALYADRDAYVEQSRIGSAHARERFGYEAHQQRLTALIGPPSDGAPTAQTVAESVTPSRLKRTIPTPWHEGERPKVLLMSSNGAGMGHLTRLLAYARRLEPTADAYFLSMSQAAPVVARLGFGYEYLPSSGALSMAPGMWQHMFVDRVSECLTRVRPDVVVFDGTWPYNGIPALRKEHPEIRWVWSRRGMWRKGANTEQVAKAEWFDLVLEPGDFAIGVDEGATRDAEATRVPPVTLLDRDDLDTRDEAREALGLPAQGPLALISLGAGNINDTADDIGAATAALGELGVGVCVTQPEIAAGSTQRTEVHLVRAYPLARRYSAFDVVISAAGYNSFQELMRMGVPSLLVPNAMTALDDQVARARYAAEHGWAHTLDKISVESATPLLADLLERGTKMVRNAQHADPGNGAAQAAEAILGVVAQARRYEIPDPAGPNGAVTSVGSNARGGRTSGDVPDSPFPTTPTPTETTS